MQHILDLSDPQCKSLKYAESSENPNATVSHVKIVYVLSKKAIL